MSAANDEITVEAASENVGVEPHAVRAFEHMQEALNLLEDLQKRYDQLVNDSIIVAAELACPPNHKAVVDRVRRLRDMERQYCTTPEERAAREAMISRTQEASNYMPALPEEERENEEYEEDGTATLAEMSRRAAEIERARSTPPEVRAAREAAMAIDAKR